MATLMTADGIRRECCKCKAVLELDRFAIDRKMAFGRSYVCKSCRNRYKSEKNRQRRGDSGRS